jgi:hypothetical protein
MRFKEGIVGNRRPMPKGPGASCRLKILPVGRWEFQLERIVLRARLAEPDAGTQ